MLVVLGALELFVIVPLRAKTDVPTALELLVAAAIVGAVFALVWRSRVALTAVVVAIGLELSATALRLAHPTERTEALDFSAGLILLVAVMVVLGIAVFGPGRVTIHRVLGAIAIYLNVAAAFALAYRLLDAQSSAAFTPSNAGAPEHSSSAFVYFSFTTLTTTGFGDIIPVDPLARSLANLEAVIGQLFPATLLARLITLELETRRRHRSQRRESRTRTRG